MKRDITEVMERIKPLLVAGGVDTKEFDRLYSSLGFVAPELRGGYWLPLCEWLAKNCPNPTLPSAPAWVRELSDIVEARK